MGEQQAIRVETDDRTVSPVVARFAVKEPDFKQLAA